MQKSLSGFDLTSRAMLATLKISSWGGQRLDRKTTRDVTEQNNAKDGALRVTKDLVGSTLDDVRTSERAIRAAHRELTLPWGEDGTRMLPTRLFSRYNEVVGDLVRRHKEKIVPAFVETYQEKVIPDARIRLGDLFNPDDYPGDDIAERFDVTVRLLPIPDTTDVRVALSKEEVEALRREVEDATREAIAEAGRETLHRALAPLERLAEALREYGAGKRLSSSLFDNVAEIGELLPDLDLTGSPEVLAVSKSLISLGSIDPSAVRNSAATRLRMAKQADEIATRLTEIL